MNNVYMCRHHSFSLPKITPYIPQHEREPDIHITYMYSMLRTSEFTNNARQNRLACKKRKYMYCIEANQRAMSDELTSEDDKQGCKRKCRNASEKKRRDQFNCLIQELGCMVSTKNRKMDKSAVLRSTINFLKAHNDNTLKSETSIKEKWKPSFLSDNEFSQLMLEALDGFLIVFSQQGHILYTSCSITSLLRHLPKDLENCTIYELVHEDDRPKIFKILSEVDSSRDNEGELLSKRFTFHCQMRRGSLQPNELVEYETVKIHGNFTMINKDEGVLPLDMGMARYCFVATVRLQTTQLSREMATFSEQQNKFMSRHSLDWKFLFLDHRGPPIIGYLPFEVLGTSVYDYYHQDDLEKVAHCHEALIQTSEGISCYYRFLTKGQEWIWLQTRNYITYNQWNSKPEFIVCMHKVVNYAEVRNDVNQSLNLTEDSRIAADKSDSGAAMDSHTSTSDMSASTSPVSSIDGDHYLKKHKKSKTLVESFHGVGSMASIRPPIQPTGPSVQPNTPSLKPPQPTPPRPHYVPPPLLCSVSSQKSTCTDNSSHLYSDQEVLPSSPSNVSAQVASDYNQNLQVQSTLAPELVMVQIKLQEQLVQRHQKLQEAIVQQQKELQAVQQQLLVAQQFLIHSNPFLQGLMVPTTQPDVLQADTNVTMDESLVDQILSHQAMEAASQAQPSMPSTSSTLVPESSGLAADPSVSAHSSMQAMGAQYTVSFFPQMLEGSQQQHQQQQHDQEQKLRQRHQEQQHLQSQLLFQSGQMMPSSSLGFLAAGQAQPSAVLPMVHPDSSSPSGFSTPRLTAPAITTPSLSMARMSSGLGPGPTGNLDSSRLASPATLQAGPRLSPVSPSSHNQSSPNTLSQAGSAGTDSVSNADYPYQIQALSPVMDPSSMGLMQQLTMPPRTQTGQ
ncbi:circadian locomoter output cycles protein kaput-like isoform X3 [Acanthaster planci]|uniref:Circadian locomoter output cycles protein kaput-like isoform X3 n=1 Tax=Acanthaster planci TaxID=133434 RepID=A0A8B7YIS1_ACAPL|nr:circadian locomoter output cycles protein kaput-like isoform X3 [Acanthaster planci]